MADIQGLDAVNAAIRNLSKVAPTASRRAMARCGLIAVREAKANAPRSPTMKQHSATLKRKKRTARRMLPGGLEKSIEYEATETGKMAVSVASTPWSPVGVEGVRVDVAIGEKTTVLHVFPGVPGLISKAPLDASIVRVHDLDRDFDGRKE